MQLSESTVEISREDTSARQKRRQFLGALVALVFTVGLAILVAFNWDMVYSMAGYGYTGGFVISAMGGGTVLVPVPMLAVQFALGGVVKPLAGPDVMGPLFVGLVCGAGETLGALSIYVTGMGGGATLGHVKWNWLERIRSKVADLIERRGKLTLFLLSAIMNPFFYPASLAMGASRFGIKRYALITLSGKIVKCSVIAYAGYFGFKGIFNLLGIDV